jgi:sulfoxide reductase heme-binding subunit YedZ
MKIRITIIQFICHLLSWLPLMVLIYDTFSNQLTANPIRETTIRTGRIAIVFLLLSLSCTPIMTLFGMDSFLHIRKELGLYAALYACLHFINFIGRDYLFDWGEIIKVIQQQTFIILGLCALLMLLILTITSIPLVQKSLENVWKKIHWLTYSLSATALLHNFMAVKGDKKLPEFYFLLFACLLVLRLNPFSHIIIRIPLLIHLNQFLKKNLLIHG